MQCNNLKSERRHGRYERMTTARLSCLRGAARPPAPARRCFGDRSGDAGAVRLRSWYRGAGVGAVTGVGAGVGVGAERTTLPAAPSALDDGASESGDESAERAENVRASVRGGVGEAGKASMCGSGDPSSPGRGGGGERTRVVDVCTDAGSVGTSGGESKFALEPEGGRGSPSIHCKDPFGVTSGVAMSGSGSVSCELPCDCE